MEGRGRHTDTSFWGALLLQVAATSATIIVASPECEAVAPVQSVLDVQTTNFTGIKDPFGIVYASNEIAFVANDYSIAVLNTSSFTPSLIRNIPVTTGAASGNFPVYGLAITKDKRTVYGATGSGAILIDVDMAVAGVSNPIIGDLNGTFFPDGAIEVTLSKDDDFAFVTMEYGPNAPDYKGAIEVFSVERAANGSVASKYIGSVGLNDAPVGTALNADGKKLYALSETMNETATQGTLSVLDVEALKTASSKAVLGNVDAGCGPVRIVLSPSGETVWVTARESNKLLVFSTAALDSPGTNGSSALLAAVQVGTSPVGVVFVNSGQHVLTADSNRFAYANATSGLTVVNVEEVLKRKKAGSPKILTGTFPREFAVSLDGKTALVSDYGSGAVQAVNISQLV